MRGRSRRWMDRSMAAPNARSPRHHLRPGLARPRRQMGSSCPSLVLEQVLCLGLLAVLVAVQGVAEIARGLAQALSEHLHEAPEHLRGERGLALDDVVEVLAGDRDQARALDRG